MYYYRLTKNSELPVGLTVDPKKSVASSIFQVQTLLLLKAMTFLFYFIFLIATEFEELVLKSASTIVSPLVLGSFFAVPQRGRWWASVCPLGHCFSSFCNKFSSLTSSHPRLVFLIVLLMEYVLEYFLDKFEVELNAHNSKTMKTTNISLHVHMTLVTTFA